jgi:PHP family Zn ribbon phosphoesterase
MAKLKGLDIIALTDHNSSQNCPAAMKVGERAGLLVIPGMELCTNEDVHIVCLFRTLSGALAFEAEIWKNMMKIKNRPDIFGEQLILDDGDNVIGNEDSLLITASAVSTDDALSLARSFGGTAFPAHADKTANGIINILGAVPPEAGFKTAELSPSCDGKNFVKKNPSLSGKLILKNSDAHYLENISEPVNFLSLTNKSVESVISLIDGEMPSKVNA